VFAVFSPLMIGAGVVALLLSWPSLQGWLELTKPAVIWVPVLAIMAYTTIIILRVVSSAAASAAPPRSPGRL
jgi:hypothetical protein